MWAALGTDLMRPPVVTISWNFLSVLHTHTKYVWEMLPNISGLKMACHRSPPAWFHLLFPRLIGLWWAPWAALW